MPGKNAEKTLYQLIKRWPLKLAHWLPPIIAIGASSRNALPIAAVSKVAQLEGDLSWSITLCVDIFIIYAVRFSFFFYLDSVKKFIGSFILLLANPVAENIKASTWISWAFKSAAYAFALSGSLLQFEENHSLIFDIRDNVPLRYYLLLTTGCAGFATAAYYCSNAHAPHRKELQLLGAAISVLEGVAPGQHNEDIKKFIAATALFLDITLPPHLIQQEQLATLNDSLTSMQALPPERVSDVMNLLNIADRAIPNGDPGVLRLSTNIAPQQLTSWLALKIMTGVEPSIYLPFFLGGWLAPLALSNSSLPAIETAKYQLEHLKEIDYFLLPFQLTMAISGAFVGSCILGPSVKETRMHFGLSLAQSKSLSEWLNFCLKAPNITKSPIRNCLKFLSTFSKNFGLLCLFSINFYSITVSINILQQLIGSRLGWKFLIEDNNFFFPKPKTAGDIVAVILTRIFTPMAAIINGFQNLLLKGPILVTDEEKWKKMFSDSLSSLCRKNQNPTQDQGSQQEPSRSTSTLTNARSQYDQILIYLIEKTCSTKVTDSALSKKRNELKQSDHDTRIKKDNLDQDIKHLRAISSADQIKYPDLLNAFSKFLKEECDQCKQDTSSEHAQRLQRKAEHMLPTIASRLPKNIAQMLFKTQAPIPLSPQGSDFPDKLILFALLDELATRSEPTERGTTSETGQHKLYLRNLGFSPCSVTDFMTDKTVTLTQDDIILLHHILAEKTGDLSLSLQSVTDILNKHPNQDRDAIPWQTSVPLNLSLTQFNALSNFCEGQHNLNDIYFKLHSWSRVRLLTGLYKLEQEGTPFSSFRTTYNKVIKQIVSYRSWLGSPQHQNRKEDPLTAALLSGGLDDEQNNNRDNGQRPPISGDQAASSIDHYPQITDNPPGSVAIPIANLTNNTTDTDKAPSDDTTGKSPPEDARSPKSGPKPSLLDPQDDPEMACYLPLSGAPTGELRPSRSVTILDRKHPYRCPRPRSTNDVDSLPRPESRTGPPLSPGPDAETTARHSSQSSTAPSPKAFDWGSLALCDSKSVPQSQYDKQEGEERPPSGMRHISPPRLKTDSRQPNAEETTPERPESPPVPRKTGQAIRRPLPFTSTAGPPSDTSPTPEVGTIIPFAH